MAHSLGILLFLYNFVHITFMLSTYDTKSRDILIIRKATYCLSLVNHYLVVLDIYLHTITSTSVNLLLHVFWCTRMCFACC